MATTYVEEHVIQQQQVQQEQQLQHDIYAEETSKQITQNNLKKQRKTKKATIEQTLETKEEQEAIVQEHAEQAEENILPLDMPNISHTTLPIHEHAQDTHATITLTQATQLSIAKPALELAHAQITCERDMLTQEQFQMYETTTTATTTDSSLKQAIPNFEASLPAPTVLEVAAVDAHLADWPSQKLEAATMSVQKLTEQQSFVLQQQTQCLDSTKVLRTAVAEAAVTAASTIEAKNAAPRISANEFLQHVTNIPASAHERKSAAAIGTFILKESVTAATADVQSPRVEHVPEFEMAAESVDIVSLVKHQQHLIQLIPTSAEENLEKINTSVPITVTPQTSQTQMLRIVETEEIQISEGLTKLPKNQPETKTSKQTLIQANPVSETSQQHTFDAIAQLSDFIPQIQTGKSQFEPVTEILANVSVVELHESEEMLEKDTNVPQAVKPSFIEQTSLTISTHQSGENEIYLPATPRPTEQIATAKQENIILRAPTQLDVETQQHITPITDLTDQPIQAISTMDVIGSVSLITVDNIFEASTLLPTDSKPELTKLPATAIGIELSQSLDVEITQAMESTTKQKTQRLEQSEHLSSAQKTLTYSSIQGTEVIAFQ